MNQHCTECDFQADCRQKALAKDNLSLLQTLSEKQRNQLNSMGVFTVAHLSYTFRPRRKPKRYIGNGEQYHHSLKALAIRERKTHVVGGDELRIEGTPVYLDVEGIPDRDFYYLIGIRVKGFRETIAAWLGFHWADANASGIQTIPWRSSWEKSRDFDLKQ